MTIGTYAVVWIDQDEARSICLDADALEDDQLRGEHIRAYRRARPGNPKERRPADEPIFFQKIANDLIAARKFLLVGHAEAKERFIRHLNRYDPRLIVRMCKIEAVDRMTDDDLVATAREYFLWRARLPFGQIRPRAL